MWYFRFSLQRWIALMMEAARTSETSVYTRLHGATSQRTKLREWNVWTRGENEECVKMLVWRTHRNTWAYMVGLCLLLFVSIGWDDVSELRLPTSLLFVPQTLYEYGALVEICWQEKPEAWRDACLSATLSSTDSTWNDVAWTRAFAVRDGRVEQPEPCHSHIKVNIKECNAVDWTDPA
jgi:hypothetical protein